MLLPCLVMDYPTNTCYVKVVPLSQFRLCNIVSGVNFTNLVRFIFSQSGLACTEFWLSFLTFTQSQLLRIGTSPVPISLGMKTKSNSVPYILSNRYVLQIVIIIIPFICIFMVHLMPFWPWPNKRFGNKSVNGSVVVSSKSSQSYSRVSILVNLLSKYPICITPVSDTCVSNSPLVADLIGVFKTKDRLPNFCGSIYQSQGSNLRNRLKFWRGSLTTQLVNGPSLYHKEVELCPVA